MSWNDGISKEISQELQRVADNIDPVTRGAFTSVIDEEVQTYERGVKNNTPVRTGGLIKAFKITKKDGGRWYGYSAEFEGNAPNGESYQKIANVLNYGKPADDHSGAIAGTHFVSKAVHKLKGMDGRIEARIAAEIAKLT